MRRRVTFSRNVTLSLSRTCVSHCKYCAFQTHRPHLHAPDEVEALIDGAARRGVKELLVLTGDDPAHHPGVRARLAELGFADFVAYVVWCCERALERGLLPHTNLGALSRDDLARLREVTASQGLMLESTRDDLVAHQGSPTKDPAVRLQTIRDAGELRIPFTSGILVGIGETEEDRVAALQALAAVHAEHGHLQEVILQNFVPHERHYGREPGEIATAAAERYWRTGLSEAPQKDAPRWACPVSLDDMVRLVRDEVLQDHLLQVAVLRVHRGERLERGHALLRGLADADEDAAGEGDAQLARRLDELEPDRRVLGRRALVGDEIGVDRLEHQALRGGHLAQAREVLAGEHAEVGVGQ
ncbi:MAG TPA: 7,8-didemethyl-8-hydroxy-5-deazariboflavin synthase subunit CofG, partial [Conexibacter sp.]